MDRREQYWHHIAQPQGAEKTLSPVAIMLLEKTGVHLAVIVAIAFAAFSPSLRGYFLADDFQVVTFLDKERKAVDWSNTLSDFYTVFRGDRTHSYYRPIISLSAALDHSLWGPRAVGFHLTNITLHAANSALVYAIAIAVPPSPNGLVGLAAGLMFALHPLHPEAIYWLAARTDLLVTLFTLSSFLLYLWFCSHRRPAQYVVSLLAFLVALGSKETAVALPLALALYTAFASAHRFSHVLPVTKAKLRWLAPYLLLLVCYFLLRKAITGFFVGQYGRPDFEVFRLSAVVKGAARLLRHQLYPLGEELMAAAGGAPFTPTARGLIVVLGWILAAASIGLALAGSWTRHSWFYLGLMLAFASPLVAVFAAGSSPFPWARLHYLPSVAYCLFLSSLLERSSRLRVMLGLFIFAGFLALLVVNSLPWIAAGRIARDAIHAIEREAQSGVERVIIAGNPDFYFGARLFGDHSWALQVAAAPPFARIPPGVQIIHLTDEQRPLDTYSAACRDPGSVLLRWNPVTLQLERVPGPPRGCL